MDGFSTGPTRFKGMAAPRSRRRHVRLRGSRPEAAQAQKHAGNGKICRSFTARGCGFFVTEVDRQGREVPEAPPRGRKRDKPAGPNVESTSRGRAASGK